MFADFPDLPISLLPCTPKILELLKGQCHEIFCFRFFSWITFPQAPDNNIRIISNFFENSRRYSQVKVHHRCQRHRRQILPPVPLVLLIPVANLPPVANNWNNIRLQIPESELEGKFAVGVNDAGGKLPPVSTTPAANLPPVSLTPVADNWNNIRLQIPESELEGKNLYLYISSTTQRWPNKIIKIFLIEDFFHLPPVSLTPVANLELRISPRIFEKIRNGPGGIIRGLGETDLRKKPEAKNLVTLSL